MKLLLLVFFSLSAFAAEDRRVEGGDLLYPGEATASTQEAAVYRATMQAAMRIELECLVVHKSSVAYDSTSTQKGGQWHARVVVGLPIAECQAAKDMSDENRAKVVHPVLSAQVQEYKKELTAPKKDATPEIVSTIKQALDRPTFVQVQPVQVVMNDRASCKVQAQEMMAESRRQALGQNRFGIANGRALELQQRALSMLASCK